MNTVDQNLNQNRIIRADGYVFDGHITKSGVRYPVWRSPESYERRNKHKKCKQRVANLSDEQATKLRSGSAKRNAARRKNKNQHINALRRSAYASYNQAVLAKNKAWRKANWEQVLESRRKPQYSIASKLRVRVLRAIKQQRAKKSECSETLLGCSVQDVMVHLQNQFKDGMSWDNHGEWHIDHIKPCSSFDLTQPTEQMECFHFTNLQPLWGYENLSKGSKILHQATQ